MTKPLSQRLEALLENLDITEVMLPFHMRTIEEAMALAKRVETAPTGQCVACDFEGYERPTWQVIDDRDAVPLTLRGKVALVTLEEA